MSPGAVHAAVPFVAQGLGRATVSLDGPWQFHEGDNLAWAQPAFDDSTWQSIETGRSWEVQGHRNLTGFAWYRRKVVVEVDAPGDFELGLLLSGVQDAAEVYWNGHLAGRWGRVWPHAQWYDDSSGMLAWPLDRSKDLRHGVLAIRVWKSPYNAYTKPAEGGLTRVPMLGESDALDALCALRRYEYLQQHLVFMMLAVLSAIVSLLALLGWLRDRSQWMLFWLALYTIRPLALLLDNWLWVPWNYSYCCVGIIFMSGDAALWMLLLYLLDLRNRPRVVRWTRIAAAFTAGLQFVECAEQFFDWTRAPRLFLGIDIGTTVPCFLMLPWAIVLIAFAFRQRLDRARWVLAVTGIVADLAVNLPSAFGLAGRWTHASFIEAHFEQPLFRLFGGDVSVANLFTALMLVAIVYAVWHYENEQREREGHVAEEFRNAQEVQQVLVPQNVPEVQGFRLTTAYRPAQEVGGDFFQLIPLPDEAAMLVIGDVSGKGLHAAMTVALIVGALRTMAKSTSDPAEVLAQLNRLLHGRMRHGFATCLVLHIKPNGECSVANAGHLPPYLNSREVELPGALPLGLIEHASYDAVRLAIAPEERLTLCTDGLPEATNQAGELFGFERVSELLNRCAHANDIAEAACNFGQEDDVTVVTLERVAVAAIASV